MACGRGGGGCEAGNRGFDVCSCGWALCIGEGLRRACQMYWLPGQIDYIVTHLFIFLLAQPMVPQAVSKEQDSANTEVDTARPFHRQFFPFCWWKQNSPRCTTQLHKRRNQHSNVARARFHHFQKFSEVDCSCSTSVILLQSVGHDLQTNGCEWYRLLQQSHREVRWVETSIYCYEPEEHAVCTIWAWAVLLPSIDPPRVLQDHFDAALHTEGSQPGIKSMSQLQ